MKIKNALISVSDKSNLESLVEELIKEKIKIFSSGGTFNFLKKQFKVFSLKQLAPFPEILDGRVKTLQPQIHAGILYNRANAQHRKIIVEKKMIPIDLVIVNLYPFQEKVQRKNSVDQIIENIDIGGLTLLRAAAKNYNWVTVIQDVVDYKFLLKEMSKNNGETTLKFRKKLAAKVFAYTAFYEGTISDYFNPQSKKVNIQYPHSYQLRYGDNPHQKASIFFDKEGDNSIFKTLKILNGKKMSYNNYLDVDSGLNIYQEFKKEKLVTIIKHQNPCGLAVSKSLEKSLELAWAGDPVSAFGSIIFFNGEVNEQIVEFLKDKFVEIIIAVSFQLQALKKLKKKRNLRIIQFNPAVKLIKYEYKIINNAVLRQEKNFLLYNQCIIKNRSGKGQNRLKKNLIDFSIKAIKKIKSNAIIITMEKNENEFMVLGVGCGQPNRLDSMELALNKAKNNLQRLFPKEYQKKIQTCVLISDAFFPFKDNIELAQQYGIKNIIEPGGSIRDPEVIQACKKYEINLYFTKTRHFFH